MRKNILSINSNKPMNYLLHTVLSDRYNFLPVSNVFQGINELKKKNEISLIIIDIDFHTQENWDFIQHIKTSGLYEDVPVIALTSDNKKTIDQNTAYYVYDFFHKPFNPADFVHTVDEAAYMSHSKPKFLAS